MMIREKSELMALFNVTTDYEEDVEDSLNHGYVVSNLAFMLARELGCSDEFCALIADAGILHDIGKLQLGIHLYGRSKDVLRIEELKYIRMHPQLGYDMLCQKDVGTEEMRKIVLHHHENYDGTGYPDNIKGNDIPAGSRILRVCDVYSALISNRPYRAAFDRNTALELMIDEVKNFDMEMFLGLMRVVNSDAYLELEDFVVRINQNKHFQYDYSKIIY